ncbi:hypothetical protein [Nostoc sp. TCL26-01]|uniref:hypothetical protein n=1 Tax=Nostoc sp. TCL26-01 TaxID=2576904 RepID=UPI0015C00423|nr:hypothetical protein [Nostoc sp. TCL26-01]QLE57515.1 hypothetical protein FD725_19540 [Nostoc sp. TCL26-01]
MNKFAQALLLSFLFAAPVAVFAPVVQAKTASSQTENTSSPVKTKAIKSTGKKIKHHHRRHKVHHHQSSRHITRKSLAKAPTTKVSTPNKTVVKTPQK